MPSRFGRVRRALTWTALAFTLILLCLWLSTRWWQVRGFVHWGPYGWTYGVAGGAAWLEYVEPPVPSQRPARAVDLRVHAIGSGWRWVPEYSWNRSPSAAMWSGVISVVVLPLWVPIILLGVPTTVLVRRDLRDRRAARRARLNLCVGCGYALTDLRPDAPCPECGRLRI